MRMAEAFSIYTVPPVEQYSAIFISNTPTKDTYSNQHHAPFVDPIQGSCNFMCDGVPCHEYWYVYRRLTFNIRVMRVCGQIHNDDKDLIR